MSDIVSPPPKRYMAAPVPRHICQSRLGYIPVNCIIATRSSQGDHGTLQVFDIITLPADQFQRMKNTASLQHVLGPSYSLQAGGTFHASFILSDIKEVLVPGTEADPEGFARSYFLMAYGLVAPDDPVEDKPPLSPIAAAARSCTFRQPKRVIG